ncbi:Gfo/Idh/MocA family oxidoreductase [Pusillimonas sp.]|uniref:Gfo/Idh/MocA family oxidoreductase n=1 Tax=Pusillimonas sp. TaxID=3040095 RepID=UPI0037C73CFF
MTRSINIAVAGAGAFGVKHLAALALIEGVNLLSVVDPEIDKARSAATRFGAPHSGADLLETLALPGLDAVILCTPTPMHARQALACLKAGKHVQVEIPLADRLEDAREVADEAQGRRLVAMCGHTRRFNPSHQYVRRRIDAGEFRLQHLVAQTYFFRRSNINALGEPRSWTDHLLWHHAAHTVDLFLYQDGGQITQAHIVQGHVDAQLGIALDMSIQLRSSTGALCTLALSFNNEGPLGTTFRYIGDTATYIASYDDLYTGADKKIDVSGVAVSMNGIELQDREFVAAILEGRESRASAASVLPCYEVLDRLEQQLAG